MLDVSAEVGNGLTTESPRLLRANPFNAAQFGHDIFIMYGTETRTSVGKSGQVVGQRNGINCRVRNHAH